MTGRDSAGAGRARGRVHGALWLEGHLRSRHSGSDGASAHEPKPHRAAAHVFEALSAAIAIGTGGPFGVEGPIAWQTYQTGSSPAQPAGCITAGPSSTPRIVLLGVVTRREIFDQALNDDAPIRQLLKGPPAVAFEQSSLRETAVLMIREAVGRLPVVSQSEPNTLVGILTRSDLLAAHSRRLDDDAQVHPRLKLSSLHKALWVPKTTARVPRAQP